ncbi:LOW QUALITY PROTEIN: xyloglucan galactosyltransferase KATAMARI1 homolog [Dioscorea cayenensis subsp. rotundata]|uniref:LOW QUALITY PROTEIN: xyloglucan galactosyltransferase KATAMARI1 homolog n=1 Tax=Dioscorea cayennensis subsp. rotundata TaxID=55577 RepID=A0AB40CK39_DIOCR|nr:LOW QUALITY PROTEIN: xyloglucan galactosyltransferase KATAMARI1 homolog [Dioscorea cayenensis subsp. rotundata]
MRRRNLVSNSHDGMEKFNAKQQNSRVCILVTLSGIFWFLIFYFHFTVLSSSTTTIQPERTSLDPIPSKFEHLYKDQSHSERLPTYQPLPHEESNAKQEAKNYPFLRALKTADNKSDKCGGRYIYVHDLPSQFNEDMLKECKSLNLWTNFCKFTTNAGLGPPLENVEGVFSNTGWYATNQFTVDVIFSNRMKQYECLTKDSSIAAAVFVPFYAGFDIARYLWGYNISVRDSASLALQDWLMKRPEWNVMGGKDHFLVGGRITWDFRRLTDLESDWGNKFLFLPAAKNMTMLVVESSPWNANDYAIPYPTYFHPAKDEDVFIWQDRMRKLERKWLFSFAGAPRPDNPKSIRGQLIDQCKQSSVCKLLECDFGESKCHSPSSIMQMFQSSLFCLQPQGDSYTRRSAFDSMLAGCIPVFFHPGSGYTQYTWHLPKNYSSYSVFIPEDDIRKKNVLIEERLKQISPDTVKTMRETVISLIPRLIYADPRSKLETLQDAFDVSVQAIIDKVTTLRKDIIAGDEDKDFIEENSWKYALLEEGQRTVGAHEWDPFFSKPKEAKNGESGSSSTEFAKKSWNNEQKNRS